MESPLEEADLILSYLEGRDDDSEPDFGQVLGRPSTTGSALASAAPAPAAPRPPQQHHDNVHQRQGGAEADEHGPAEIDQEEHAGAGLRGVVVEAQRPRHSWKHMFSTSGASNTSKS